MNSEIWTHFEKGVEKNRIYILKNPELIDKFIDDYFKQMSQLYEIHEISEGFILDITDEIDVFLNDRLSLAKYFCFLASSFLDQLVCLKGIMNSSRKWEEVFFTNRAVLIIYETFETYKAYQKSFSYQVSENYSRFESSYRSIAHLRKEFIKNLRIESLFKDVRNQVSGHYAKEFTDYFHLSKRIDSIEAEKALHLSMGLLKLKMDLIYSMVDLDDDGL